MVYGKGGADARRAIKSRIAYILHAFLKFDLAQARRGALRLLIRRDANVNHSLNAGPAN